MKQFVKALNTENECFQHIVSAFPGLSFDKIKAGVFDGPHIRSLIRDKEFVRKMDQKERAAWMSFVAVINNFLGNKKAENCVLLVQRMLKAFCDLGCNMSIKTVSYTHLDVYKRQLVTSVWGSNYIKKMMKDITWSLVLMFHYYYPFSCPFFQYLP